MLLLSLMMFLYVLRSRSQNTSHISHSPSWHRGHPAQRGGDERGFIRPEVDPEWSSESCHCGTDVTELLRCATTLVSKILGTC